MGNLITWDREYIEKDRKNSQKIDNLLEGDISARARKRKDLLGLSAFHYFEKLDQEAERIRQQKKRAEQAAKEATRKRNGL